MLAFLMIRTFFLSRLQDPMLLPYLPKMDPLKNLFFFPSFPPYFFTSFSSVQCPHLRHYAGLTNIQIIKGIVSIFCTSASVNAGAFASMKKRLNCDVGV